MKIERHPGYLCLRDPAYRFALTFARTWRRASSPGRGNWTLRLVCSRTLGFLNLTAAVEPGLRITLLCGRSRRFHARMVRPRARAGGRP